MTTTVDTHTGEKKIVSSRAGDTGWRAHLLKALPWLWLGMSAAWAVVIFTTDQLAWPLALWIATTVGPLTALNASGVDRLPG
ncbi:MAG: hypothetical protein R8J94_15050 [Acidimicrobiia bacterium]|nr:hypothetical protein [Acidimicrobiia bacterium]